MILVKAAAFVLGASIVVATLLSAIQTLVLPRSAPNRLTRTVFKSSRRVFNLRLRRARTYAEVDSIHALFAPISLMLLLPTWLALTLLGFMAMFWSLGVPSWAEAF